MEKFEHIAKLIEPSLEDMGYELVRVKLSGDKNKTLQIMAERKDNEPMTVDDCEKISHQVSAILDVEDPITEAYNLEVSSPGMDRPLTRLKDFTRFSGHTVKLQTTELLENRRKFNGIIKGITKDEKIIIHVDDKEFLIPFSLIDSAKIVITNDMLK